MPPGVLVSGVTQKPTIGFLGFRSFGNVENGNAFVMRIPLSALTGSTAPSTTSIMQMEGFYYMTFAGYSTSHAVRMGTPPPACSHRSRDI